MKTKIFIGVIVIFILVTQVIIMKLLWIQQDKIGLISSEIQDINETLNTWEILIDNE